jgi:hypothetical protein
MRTVRVQARGLLRELHESSLRRERVEVLLEAANLLVESQETDQVKRGTIDHSA